MGLDDKLRNKAEDVQGRGQETADRATGDKELEAEGQVDQNKADRKDTGEKVNDAFRK